MMVRTRVLREARDAVIAARFQGAPPPANPYQPRARSHRWWEMGVRSAEQAADALLRIGA